MDSTSSRQSGQHGLSWIPLLKRVPLTGIAWWKICHRKILIFGIISMFLIHLWAQYDSFNGWKLWASHVAVLVVNSSVLSRPQHRVPSRLLKGVSISRIFWIMVWSCITVSNFGKFHCLCGVINSATFTKSWCNDSAYTCKRSIRLQFSIQLSNQKEILCPLPSLQRRPWVSNWRFLSKLFQICVSGSPR